MSCLASSCEDVHRVFGEDHQLFGDVSVQHAAEPLIIHDFFEGQPTGQSAVLAQGIRQLLALDGTGQQLVDDLPCAGRTALGAGQLLFEALDVLRGLHLAGQVSFVGGLQEADAPDLSEIHADRVVDHLRRLDALLPRCLGLGLGLLALLGLDIRVGRLT